MSELDTTTPNQQFDAAAVTVEEDILIKNAEGLLYDEWVRICQKVGASAVAETHDPTTERAIRLQARWGLTP